jgi:hypothetical protein
VEVTNRNDAKWTDLVRDVAARVDAYAPGWTDHRDSDPGITLVQLFAFLAESILERGDAVPAGRSRVQDVLDRLGPGADPCGDPPRRNRYALGMVLGVDDFTMEQAYVREKQRRHNLHLHGFGTVDGLEVSVEPTGTRPLVTVSAGLAIGPDGEELITCKATTIRSRTSRSPCYVTVRLVDRPVDPVAGVSASRVEEVTEIAVVARVPADQLPIGRLERVDGTWRVDASFEPRHLGRR